MNYDNYYKNGGMTKEESVSAIALRIGARKEAVAKFVEKNNIDTNKLNSDLKSGQVYFLDVITAIVGKPNNKYEKEIVKKYGNKMAMGGKTQGYDDREDERLGMKYGKMSGKDFDGSHDMREHSRRDDARFEERMADGGELTYDDFMVGDFYFNSSEGGKFKFVGKDESGRLRFEDSKGIDRIFSPKRMSKYADGGMMARGGYVSKGELVWKKLTNSERMNFLYKNFTPQITPRSQETLVGKDYNFLPKNVKIVIESKYANVEEYADGGETERKAEAIKTAVEIATMAYKNGVRAYDMDFEDFSERIFYISKTSYPIVDLRLAYNALLNSGYKNGGMMADGGLTKTKTGAIKLYYHQTSGGAEYLCSSKVKGTKDEGSFDSEYIARIDGAKDFGGELLTKGVKLYYHQTSGGAEYLCSSKVKGTKDEGSFDSEYIVRIDGAKDFGGELLTKVLPYAKGGMMAHGGAIEDQYEGRSAKDIWESCNEEQKVHFFTDHKQHPYYNMGDKKFVVSKNDREKYVYMSYEELPKMVKLMISDHVEEGEYKKGGVLKEGDYVWNAVGNKLVVNKVSDDEYFLSAFGQIGDSPFSKEKVEMYLKNGQWSRKPKMAKGGTLPEQNQLNKKVLALIQKANIESKLEFGQLVVSAFTDANAHSKVRKFISIIEKKPEWAEKPKEIDMKLPREEFQKQRAKTVYGSKYYDANEKIDDLGVEIANMSGWGFESILDSLIFASKMSGRNDVAQVLEKLNTDDDKQDTTKNKWEYTDKDEIEYVVVKDKYGEELKFEGKDVISGVHDLLEKGGKLTEIGKYYSKNDVVSVFVNGKNILDKNTVSGVWIKKDAEPNKDKFNKDEFNEGIVTDLYENVNGKKIRTQNQRSIKEAIESANENSKYYKGYAEVYIGAIYVGSSRNGVFKYSSKYKGTKYDQDGMKADAGFVVVSENDGYWYIMSKPTSKQVAEEFLSTLTIPRGEVGKVVSVEDAKNHKKVIGRKYLKMADGGDVSEMKIGQTTVRKGYNGWVGKTMVDNFKGYDWDITTIKNSRGDLTTTAQGGKSEDKGGYKMFTFMLYQDPSVRLQTSRPARVNEKVVSEQHAEALKVFKEKVGNTPDKEKMADGGAIGFDALAKKVAKNYEGDEVKKQYQDEYGKTYDKKEAEEVGKKVAGKVYGQQQAKKKMAKGGKVAKKSGSPANRSQSKMTLISRKASEIRKANESWRDAFNRAKAMLYS